MSQLSKREEVWIRAYAAFISSRVDSIATVEDAAYADKALSEFDKRFPVVLKLQTSEGELEAFAKKWNDPILTPQYTDKVEAEWGISSDRQEELKGIASRVKQWLAETEEKEILRYLANNDVKSLERLRDVICGILKDKTTENNSQL